METIRWPAKYDPAVAPVHVANEVQAKLAADVVFSWLVHAAIWPTWYPNSADVVIDGNAQVLSPGVRFRWRTFGVRLNSTVEEFVPNGRIAWSARGIGVDAYHAWLIEPVGDRVRILTEETQYGWLARLGAICLPWRMHQQHQIWLERLCEKASGGPPV